MPGEIVRDLEKIEKASVDAVSTLMSRIDKAVGERPIDRKKLPEREQVRRYLLIRDDPAEWKKLLDQDGPKPVIEEAIRLEKLLHEYPDEIMTIDREQTAADLDADSASLLPPPPPPPEGGMAPGGPAPMMGGALPAGPMGPVPPGAGPMGPVPPGAGPMPPAGMPGMVPPSGIVPPGPPMLPGGV